MNQNQIKFQANKILLFPLLYGVIGAFLGLILRLAFTGSIEGFSFKNVLHSHSHVMLLGFVFNALLIIIWLLFSDGLDKINYRLFMILQICIAVFMVAFILQGYAFVSILFSTIHLWVSYVLLIRIWRQLPLNNAQNKLIKLGIVFFFISSIGPYMLGPLMALELQHSPWYQQAIFFYLHFQYFGAFFVWMLAALFAKAEVSLSKKQFYLLLIGLILLYAHSLDFNFNHWAIQLCGTLGSIGLILFVLPFIKAFNRLNHGYKFVYYVIVLIALMNVLGSIPFFAELVVENRFILIAWLHLLFLGLYTPFIWLSLPKKISPTLWLIYTFTFVISEMALIFPNLFLEWMNLPIMWVLFYAYLILFICICWVHIANLRTIIANSHRNT